MDTFDLVVEYYAVWLLNNLQLTLLGQENRQSEVVGCNNNSDELQCVDKESGEIFKARIKK